MATDKLQALKLRLHRLTTDKERLAALVEQLGDHSDLAEVERLSNSLVMVDAQLASVRKEIGDAEADEAAARAAEDEQRRSGLLQLYDQHKDRLSSLPEALRRKVLEAHRLEGERRLVGRR